MPLPDYTDFRASMAAQQRLHEVVPGGAHTYARGHDQYPEYAAPVLDHGRGARVVDVDGHEYVEYGMGLRAVTLGHAHPAVDGAVRDVIGRGVSFVRPTSLELAAAEDFLSMVPTAQMVKFAKNGSDVTTAAVRLARAATGRSLVAIADQPFYSTDDWFIGNGPMPSGVPREIADLTVGFAYNDLESLTLLFDALPGQIAAVLLEAATASAEPAPGFLEGVRALCDRHGAVLVFDEMITGLRWSSGGAQSIYGVQPDLSCWGKALGNGYAISALAGSRDLMELGGLRTRDERVFLLSTTNGPEAEGLAAFRAVRAVYAEADPVGAMERAGERLAAGVRQVVAAEGLQDAITVRGRSSCLMFGTADHTGAPSQAFRTLFLAELIRHGVLGQSFVVSAAHTDEDIDQTVAAVQAALPAYRRALEAGSVAGLLEGRPVGPSVRATADPRFMPRNVADDDVRARDTSDER